MTTCAGCGGIVGRDCFNPGECQAIARAKAADYDMQGDVHGEIAHLQDQVQHLRHFIRFWSYCTWRGMLSECPERREELRELFRTANIDPYASEASK